MNKRGRGGAGGDARAIRPGLFWRSIWIAAALVLVLPTRQAYAGSVSVQSLGGGDLNVIPVAYPPETVAPAGLGHSLYRYCWKRTSQWLPICAIRSQESYSATQQLGGFTNGLEYELRAECWCRIVLGPGNNIWGWRPVGSTIFTYMPPQPPQPQLVRTDRVRIRNVSTSQCIYVDPNGWVTRHWVCWPDPNMVFYRDVYSDGFSTFRDRRSGRCLWGAERNAPQTGSADCGAIGTRFQVQDAGGGRVRLYVPFTGDPLHLGAGGCFFTFGGNGNTTLKEPCTGDPRTLFVLDPA